MHCCTQFLRIHSCINQVKSNQQNIYRRPFFSSLCFSNLSLSSPKVNSAEHQSRKKHQASALVPALAPVSSLSSLSTTTAATFDRYHLTNNPLFYDKYNYECRRSFWGNGQSQSKTKKKEVQMDADTEVDIEEDKKQKSFFTKIADSFESNTTIHKSFIFLGGSAIFGLSYLVYDVVFGFMTMKPLDMGLYGLYTGILSAGAGVGLANYMVYNLAISPEVAYQKSMNTLFYNKQAYNLIGGGYIRNAILSMKAYKQTGKYITLDGYMPVYDPITIHMMYVVKGSTTNKPFLVTCSVQKVSFKTEVIYLGLQKVYTDDKCLDTRPQWLGELEVITGRPSETCLQLANGASFNLDYKNAIMKDKIPIPQITAGN